MQTMTHALRNGGLSRRGFLQALGITVTSLMVPGLAMLRPSFPSEWTRFRLYLPLKPADNYIVDWMIPFNWRTMKHAPGTCYLPPCGRFTLFGSKQARRFLDDFREHATGSLHWDLAYKLPSRQPKELNHAWT